ncbi:MAG: FtsW/RodA/SpoVE family cell cycle protein, partial [Rickettsiales bacterium]
MELNRTNTTVMGRWWWTIDRFSLFAVLFLVAIGAVLVTASSPSVAERIGLEQFYFVKRQLIFLVLSIGVMLGISLLNEIQVRRLAILGFLGSLGLLMLLPFIGYEVKGAVRWVYLAGISVQPSEFMKPCFAVVMAWIFSERFKTPGFPGYRVAVALYALVAFLLVIQPDVGMTITISVIWMTQFFLAGLPFIWVIVMGG